MIIKILLTLAFCFTCLFAYAGTVTYYFDAYDAAGEEWQQNPANMSDGSIETHAYTQLDEDINLLDSNTCDGTNLGTISKVELRIYGYTSEAVGTILLRPIFSGGDGSNHDVGIINVAWSSYIDITSDTNAPATWSWTNIQNLDCDVESDSAGTVVYVEANKVEIKVTYVDSTRRIIMVQ